VLIYIVIPVYNENEAVVLRVLKDLEPLGHFLVVIDDGSDKAIKIGGVKNLIVLRHRINLGQGAALQTGFDYALKKNADFVVTFDADGQHLPEDITSLIEPVEKGRADVVLGSRFLSPFPNKVPWNRKLLLQVARYINYLFTGVLLSDAHNGLRVFNRKALQKIRITENRMAHATEIISGIRKEKLRYVEIPVQVKYSSYSRKKGQSSWSGIRIVFDLVLHKMFS
jgi:glycosyltransferase involved in cell wall biosynthesis